VHVPRNFPRRRISCIDVSIDDKLRSQLYQGHKKAMAASGNSVTDQLAQLDAARSLVLGDAAFYPQIVQGILPIIGAKAQLELRRWGADFLAETFATPAFPNQQKEQLSLLVLQPLLELLEIPGEDAGVLKSVVQAAASIYPLVFRHMYV